MQISSYNSQNFSMDIKTKNGNHLSFSMYDKKEAKFDRDGNSATLSLRNQFGFSFSYSGSKLSEEEIEEIKEAVAKVQPQIDEFMKNSRVGTLKPKEIITTAMKIGNALPESTDEEHKKATLHELFNTMDKSLNKEMGKTDLADIKKQIFQDSTKLLEEIWEQYKSQEEKAKEEENKEFGFYA
ncbi:invasion antigen I [Campylobacter subantarcticus LMG 24377]|uniref:Invasion antigen I n=2 Tax=Campylobacter subantarcticus TaxID=497724 RepID=A0A0A8HBL1_9BACT|nr:invasion antigen I [Campylobacter subantarcticus]EAJ1261191.1 invasion antigen I [Campylobacter lari]AJC90329.1 invasion antigen I [Campylobacter subantarcticus LMG 24374]AJC91991.1 invasion antigen I [Campylobacter subantarcticus LMG 24377]EAL3939348.1 invasion antigen I [Campylobacter lari]MPB98707.1 invasion antigen I [Campylobacter subantarcticus]